jgi:hypothetical protein
MMVLQLPEPDAARQAHPFDPSTADKAAVDAERALERTIREDQTRRVVAVLREYDELWSIQLVEHVDTEPGW